MAKQIIDNSENNKEEKATSASGSPHRQLIKYIEQQQQKLLRCYSLKQLADHFTDWYNNDSNYLILADNFLAVGLEYKPAEFRLTGLGIALGRDRDEIVYHVKYSHGNTEKNVILHAETYPDRCYTLFNVIQDIFSGLQGEIINLLAPKSREISALKDFFAEI